MWFVATVRQEMYHSMAIRTDHTFHITRNPKPETRNPKPETRNQAQTKILKLHHVCKKVSNITVLIILYKTVLTFVPLIVIIIPAADRKILHLSARMGLPFHRLLG